MERYQEGYDKRQGWRGIKTGIFIARNSADIPMPLASIVIPSDILVESGMQAF